MNDDAGWLAWLKIKLIGCCFSCRAGQEKIGIFYVKIIKYSIFERIIIEESTFFGAMVRAEGSQLRGRGLKS